MVARPVSDLELAHAASRGDEAAFVAIVRGHADAVFGHALRFFGDRQAAEDATQEVFIKVFRTISSYDGRSRLSTWLYRVTHNVCLDMVRSGKRVPIPVDPVAIEPLSIPDFADDVAFTSALARAMATLSPEDRDALGAIAVFGLSYDEAAGALDVPVGTVKSRVFRARRTLASLLVASEGGEPDGLPASM